MTSELISTFNIDRKPSNGDVQKSSSMMNLQQSTGGGGAEDDEAASGLSAAASVSSLASGKAAAGGRKIRAPVPPTGKHTFCALIYHTLIEIVRSFLHSDKC